MNALIETVFQDFTVDGQRIPVSFGYYEGHGEPFVVYRLQDASGSLYTDDGLYGYVEYYDFSVYAQSNYNRILKALRDKLEENGFTWQVSLSSGDMYDEETGFYYRTLNFAIFKEGE